MLPKVAPKSLFFQFPSSSFGGPTQKKNFRVYFQVQSLHLERKTLVTYQKWAHTQLRVGLALISVEPTADWGFILHFD